MKRTTPCRGCGAEIRFIKMTNGKSMPVDPDPVDVFEETSPGPFINEDGVVKRKHQIEHEDGEDWYMSHFATCTEAQQFRMPRQSGPGFPHGNRRS